MIYCPNCKTANRDNSKFCNECGTDLTKGASLRCQLCGTMNPADKTNCSHCGARLQLMADDEPAEIPEEEARPVEAALRELRSTAQSGTSASDEPQPAAPTVPTAQSEPSTPKTESDITQPAAPPTPEEALPDWLRELRAGQMETPVADAAQATQQEQASVEPTRAEEFPAWLAKLRQGPSKPAEPAATTAAEPMSELPSWLADLQKPSTTPSEQTVQAKPSAEAATQPELAAPTEAPSAAEISAVPDWLKELAPAQPAEPSTAWSMPDVAVEELPDWLKPIAAPPSAPPTPSQPPAPPPTPAVTAAEAAVPLPVGMAPGELPPWLQKLRPGAGLETLSGDVIETSGLLAGIRGALPVETALTVPHKVEPTKPAEAVEMPLTGFAELFAPPPPPPAPPPPARRKARTRSLRDFWRLLLGGIILSLVALPSLPFYRDSGLRGAEIPTHPDSYDFYKTIDVLPANSLVLVALDYAGGARAELDPQASAALLHLLNKQRVLALSFVPEGGQLAQELFNNPPPIFKSNYRYGDNFLNLGYQAGNEAGLRSLTQNPSALFSSDYRDHKSISSFNIGKDWRSLKDVAMLMVFSDDGEQVKRWIEQVAQPSGKPLLVGASASAAPALAPYRSSGQVKAMLSGLRGAAEYELLLSNPSTAAASLDAITYVALVLIGLIVLGNLAGLVMRH